MGISEQDMIGTAAGLALAGKRAFVSTFVIFGSRAWEQTRNTVARADLSVFLVFTHAGISVGPDGASAQANEDIALMRVIPNMRVLVPADAHEVRAMVEALAQDGHGPYYMRLARPDVPDLFGPEYRFQLGRSVLLRPGSDITLCACGQMVVRALEAADELAGEGIDARVLNMSTIKPLDREAVLAAARETGGIVTAEEHSVLGGLGSAVAELVSEEAPVPVARVGMPDEFGKSGEPDELLARYQLTPEQIVRRAREVRSRARNR
jgi:transketolase